MPPLSANVRWTASRSMPSGSQRERSDRGCRTLADALMIRARFGRRGQLGDIRVPEELNGVQDQTGLPRPRHHLDAEDRIDADLEEILVDTDTVTTQQVGRDPGQDLLRNRARGDIFGGRSVTAEHCGWSEGRSVELAVGRKG